MVEYLDVMDSRGLLDYSELIVARCRLRRVRAPVARALRERYDLVVVDEYQDTDPAQERLLQAIAGDGRDLVVVGDPDQSIYAFRGADVRGITEFPDRFRSASGEQAPILTLRTSRRCADAVLHASRRRRRASSVRPAVCRSRRSVSTDASTAADGPAARRGRGAPRTDRRA